MKSFSLYRVRPFVRVAPMVSLLAVAALSLNVQAESILSAARSLAWATAKQAENLKGEKPAVPKTGDDAETKPGAPADDSKGISPQAQILIDQLSQGYSNVTSAELSGSITVDIDVDGQKQKQEQPFTGAYQSPNKFKHDFGSELVIGSSGEKVYLLSKPANQYLAVDAPKGRFQPGEMPVPVAQLLQGQNPSLLFALIENPISGLVESSRRASTLPDIKINDSVYKQLTLSQQETGNEITILIDPNSHLVRRLSIDMKPSLEKSGASQVKNALVTIDYTTIKTNAEFGDRFFAWSPPEGAKEIKPAEEPESPAQSLTGKPAPDFSLKSLDGSQTVALSDLKGQTVVLDFWATWCPPCVRSLPHLQELHEKIKDRPAKVYAVNLREDREKVEAFLKQKKLNIPVLLDSEGDVAEKYLVSSIPQTVVIGPDGNIKKVYVGFSPGMPAELEKDVLTESAKPK